MDPSEVEKEAARLGLVPRQRWYRRRGQALRALVVTLLVAAAMGLLLRYWLDQHPYRAHLQFAYKATDLAGAALVVLVLCVGLLDAGRKWARTRPKKAWSERNEPPVGGRYVTEDEDHSVFVVAEKLLGDHRRWKEIWQLNEGRRVARRDVWTRAHQRLRPGYVIAVPDAALRRLAQARTLRPESPPQEEPTALEPAAPRAMPRPRRRTG